MFRAGMKLPLSTLAGIALLLVATGCAEYHLPRIDPSGEHLFICDSPPPAATCPPGSIPLPPAVAICPSGTVPMPAPAARRWLPPPGCRLALSGRRFRPHRSSRPIAT